MPNNLPNQRWHIFPPQPQLASELAKATQLSPLLAQVLINRGIQTIEAARAFLNPDSVSLPHPLQEFPDLELSVQLLEKAIATGAKIAICGDYDADGMTSTALLLRTFRVLGAIADYAIPSRLTEGYGINNRMVKQLHQDRFTLILTVDNGIAATEPIAKARQLGLDVIITDHHDIPLQLPPATAILNPKLISELSPYRGLAGVGVAYILAATLAQKLGKDGKIYSQCLELFTLGTIADLAPLVGVNRRWLKRGLRSLPHSQIAGVQALIQVSGVNQRKTALKPEDIGFLLGPRINAVGRISNPQIVIDLLTTEDDKLARERAMECESTNQKRQELCEAIECAAVAICEKNKQEILGDRVLVIVQENWHHGVIGIVASRLVERYGVPVFIGTYEAQDYIRGSARGIPEFHVFEALLFCNDLLEKYGGHKAAGGFSMLAKNLDTLRTKLRGFAHKYLKKEHIKPLIKIDCLADFQEIDLDFYENIDSLHPCGIENNYPVFWTPNVRILEQKIVGKGHVKLTVGQRTNAGLTILKAIAWRWQEYFPLPTPVDIAYKLRENNWNGRTTVELELVGARRPTIGS